MVWWIIGGIVLLVVLCLIFPGVAEAVIELIGDIIDNIDFTDND